MKIAFTSLIIFFCFLNARGQDSLKNFNYSRNNITATGMEVLGSWAIVNLGVGLAGWAGSKGGENRSFYQMTTIWGGINLALAIPGRINALRDEQKTFTPAESLKAQQRIERIFLVNGGLDVVYISAGTFMKIRGDNNNSVQLQGYGSSIIIQGAFLLFFDSTMYATQRGNGNKLRRFLLKNPITFNGRQVGMVINM
jgi:hypothetical protein